MKMMKCIQLIFNIFLEYFNFVFSDMALRSLTLFSNIQRYYHYLELKSKHQDAAVPPLDEMLRRITDPDPELLSQNKTVIDEFKRCFELKENPKVILISMAPFDKIRFHYTSFVNSFNILLFILLYLLMSCR